jgi:TRAP-type C4-dicarboxylate transport system permease small subunit
MPNPDAGARPSKVAAALSGGARWVCYFAIFLILLLPLPIIYEVIADQLGRPPIWVFEITGYTIIMIAFAASGYGLSTGHHFRVNLVSEHFPALARPLDLLSALFETAFGIILLVAGAMQAYGAFAQDLRSDTLLQIPQGWPFLAFPIGGLAIMLQGLAHLAGRPQARAAQ